VRIAISPVRLVARARLPRDAVERSLRVGDGDAGSQPRDASQEMESTHARFPRAEGDRRPQLRAERAIEQRGHHADDRVRPIADDRRPPDDARVPREPSLPEPMREHDDVVLADLLLGKKRAPDRRRHAECREVVRGHHRGGNLLGITSTGDHRRTKRGLCGKGTQHAIPFAVVEEVRR
jgi:hypothetical protein